MVLKVKIYRIFGPSSFVTAVFINSEKPWIKCWSHNTFVVGITSVLPTHTTCTHVPCTSHSLLWLTLNPRTKPEIINFIGVGRKGRYRITLKIIIIFIHSIKIEPWFYYYTQYLFTFHTFFKRANTSLSMLGVFLNLDMEDNLQWLGRKTRLLKDF